jgi:hypothetical protein
MLIIKDFEGGMPHGVWAQLNPEEGGIQGLTGQLLLTKQCPSLGPIEKRH